MTKEADSTQQNNIEALVESKKLAREKEYEDKLETEKMEFKDNLKKEMIDYKEELLHQEIVTAKISEIIDEEDSSITTKTLNKLMPWFIENKHLIDISLLSEFSKKSVKKENDPNKKGNRTFLILKGKEMSEKMPEFYELLIKKPGVYLFEEDKDLIVVRSKNYGPTISDLAKKIGYKDTPDAFNGFKVASKSIDVNKINVEELKEKPLSYFKDTE